MDKSVNLNLLGIVAGAFFLCSCSGETTDTDLTIPVEPPSIDFNYLSVSDGRIQIVHGINYDLAAADGFKAVEPKNRVDNFDGTPYKISLGAFIGDDSALMIHAETVADLSGASDYSNLPLADWPNEDFRSGGHVCLEVPEEAMEGEHDLLWLRENGFDPEGTLLFGQYFATTADMNTEVVLSILLKLSSCDDEAANAEVIRDFQAKIAVTNVE